MAFLYSERLLTVHNATAATYTVPFGHVVIVRDVACFYSGGAGSETGLVNEVNATFVHFSFPASATGSYGHWDGRQVLPPGAQFHLSSSDGVDLTVTGYQLVI